MVEDRIAILKVGPALTYGLREALFSLSMMERELVPTAEQAFLIETLEEEMLGKQDWWKKHYHGDYRQVGLSRKYSFSDRARYYFSETKIQTAIEKFFTNLRKYPIPMNMLHQYMPKQFDKVRSGKLQSDPKALALDGVAQIMADYEQAVGQKRKGII